MGIFSCWWQWLLLGGLLGLLTAWWLARGAFRRAWDSWHSERNGLSSQHAAALQTKHADYLSLRTDFDTLKAKPATIVEKIVDRPITVEKIVEKIVDRPVTVEKFIDRPVTIEKIVEKIVDRPVTVEKIVEKFIDRPITVEKIVERIVEKPVTVEKIVDRLVDNPLHLGKIRDLETQVALIAGLRASISSLESRPPKIVEKIVDRPVTVEKIVEKIVDRPVTVEKIVEKIVDRPVTVEKIVEKIVDRPVTVEKIVDRPVEKIVEKIVDRMVDNPVHLGKIRDLELRVSDIDALRTTIATLEARPPKVVEKIVNIPVDRIVEKIVDRPVTVEKIVEKIIDRPVDRIVEKIVDRPVTIEKIVEKIVDRPVTVEKIVEKVVDRMVDNPVHLTRIRDLEGQVGLISGLRASIATLEARPPTVVEKIVDRPVTVEKIVDRTIDNPVHLKTIADLRAEIAQLKVATATVDKVAAKAAKAAGFAVRGMDDLEVIEGIGPKIAGLLNAAGVYFFGELAQMTPAAIQVILDKAGSNYALAVPETWPQQAGLCANNRWTELKVLQDNLTAGRKK